TPDVSFRRIYEYAGGDWQEDNGVWHQNVFAYYLSISCNHCEDSYYQDKNQTLCWRVTILLLSSSLICTILINAGSARHRCASVV
ncbi:hypothetical protein ONO84_24620, partial [Salmonella enterica subsp. enterica serovar Virginia]|nr:hypothetical protein [Salmonella enterica subsp. enterica serovar Virginia]